MRRTNELLQVSLWLALAGFGAPAAAADGADPADEWQPVDAEQLDAVRGGFTTPAGLAMSLGIEKIVSINGDVVARTRIDIADLNRLNAEQVIQTHDALSSVKLIQNGSANIYQAGESAQVLGGVVIQNTLNDQLIRSQTVISASVNSGSLLKSLNFQSSLNDALARAVSAQ
jgi:hypothetical protein